MKSKLIVNPVSGADAAPDHLPMMNSLLRERFDALDIAITVGEGDATKLAEDAVRDGYEQIFVAGGDGTLNEVLNGVGRAGGLEAVTFGLIPLGTGNDFATALGLPEDVEGAIRMLLDGTPVAVDVGVMNDRLFVNVSAGGFIAEVSDAVHPQLKTLTGKLAYLIGGAQVLLDYEPVGARVTVQDGTPAADGFPSTSSLSDVSSVTAGRLHAFAVCNSRLVGGGRLIAPDAMVDDGYLDVCLIHAMPTIDFLALLRRVSAGDHVGDDRVAYFRARQFEVAFDRTIKVNTDGQVLDVDRCRYRVLPGAARFLAKRKAAATLQD